MSATVALIVYVDGNLILIGIILHVIRCVIELPLNLRSKCIQLLYINNQSDISTFFDFYIRILSFEIELSCNVSIVVPCLMLSLEACPE